MRGIRLILRLLAIQRVLMKYGLDDFVWATHLLRPVGWLTPHTAEIVIQ